MEEKKTTTVSAQSLNSSDKMCSREQISFLEGQIGDKTGNVKSLADTSYLKSQRGASYTQAMTLHSLLHY